MSRNAHKLAQTGLQWSLGLILAYESARLVLSTHSAGKAHIPKLLLLGIGLLELAGAILFLLPPTFKLGASLLLASFGLAAVVHILHGQPDVGFLLIYAMAVLTITTNRA